MFFWTKLKEWFRYRDTVPILIILTGFLVALLVIYLSGNALVNEATIKKIANEYPRTALIEEAASDGKITYREYEDIKDEFKANKVRELLK